MSMTQEAQLIFNILMTVAAFCGGWVLKVIYDAIKRLESRDDAMDQRLNELLSDIPNTYMRRDDVLAVANRLEEGMRDLGKTVNTGFERIYDKLDGKQDKPK